MNKRPPIDFETIKQGAKGKYLNLIFPAVGITLRGNPNHHQPCPICGGKDRFRCDDKGGDGTYICNHCGAGDGVKLVQQYTNSDYYETMKMIASIVGIDTDSPISDEQKQQWRADQIARDKKQAEQDRQAEQNAIAKANQMWSKATDPNPNHPYLVKKCINPMSIKQLGELLLIPLYYYNIETNQKALANLQTIDKDGNKKFLSGGKVAQCYSSLNTTAPQNNIIMIAEGYATAMTVLHATDYQYPMIVAFNANNLNPVSQFIRKQLPNSRIMIIADNDNATAHKSRQADIDNGKQPKDLAEYNVGIKKATETALTVGGEVVYPIIPNTNQGIK